MKRKVLLTLLFLLPVMIVPILAQPMASMKVPYNQIIISEINHGGSQNSYVELTNVGDSTVNMKDLFFWSCDQRSVRVQEVVRNEEGVITNIYLKTDNDQLSFYVRGKDQLLKPGESYVGIPVWDGTYEDGLPIQRMQLVDVADHYLHVSERSNDTTIAYYSYPEYQVYNFDSVSFPGAMEGQTGRSAFSHGAHNRIFMGINVYNDAGEVVDSVAIDGFKLIFVDETMGDWNPADVGGVVGAPLTYSFARKATVTQGNLNWDLSSGISKEFSEWLFLPKIEGRDIFTTIGVHGDYNVDATSETVTFNNSESTMVVPFGTYKGDSLVREITLGEGNAWQFVANGSDFASQGFTTTQDGDTLKLYGTGNDLDSMIYAITVAEADPGETRLFEKYMVNPDPPVDELTGAPIPEYLEETPFKIIRLNGAAMDTIANIPFATRVDSLFKYLEKAPNASLSFVWVDGTPRADVKYGDILRVTAENGTDTRDYFLKVEDYIPSDNAFLASITWPDKPGFLLKWKQDTIPYFDSNVLKYTLPVPYTTTGVPALQVTKIDPNSTVEVIPATSLEGTNAERTTTIIVTAEDQEKVLTYTVTFRKEKPRELVQPWHAEPIITQMGYRSPGNPDATFEVFNPGTEPIDLSNYLFVPARGRTFEQMINELYNLDSDHYGYGYIPGMRWPADPAEQILNPGIMQFDPAVDPILEPGETFTLFTAATDPDHPVISRVNVVLVAQYGDSTAWKNAGGNQWGQYLDHGRMGFYGNRNTRNVIFKILNDSIKSSLKPIRDIEDFELIDMFGYSSDRPIGIAGRTVAGGEASQLRRKSHVYLPTTEIMHNWYPNSADSSDWILEKSGDVIDGVEYTSDMLGYDIGVHFVDPVTFYSSVVFSNVYKVDEGYTGDIYVRGVSTGETVQGFLNNIIKDDEGQTLKVLTSIGGSEKAASDVLAETDILEVISSDSTATTDYKLSFAALDDNNTLTLITGSDYTISREGDAGVVTGFPLGTTIADVLQDIQKPEKAAMTIVNGDGELLPLTVMNNDTAKVNSIIGLDVYLKVVAENADVAMYHLQPASSSSDAFVFSDIYVVNEEESQISLVQGRTTVSSFFANILLSPGATAQVIDREGVERTFGIVAYDDYLLVKSEDESVIRSYIIQFIGEKAGDVVRGPAEAPTNIRLESVSSEGTVTIAWDYEFGFEYGFIIVRDGVTIDTVLTNSYTEDLTLQEYYEYSVFAYNEFGNSSSVELGINVWPTVVDEYIANKISVYPNVTADFVYFRNLPVTSQVVVFDITGTKLISKKSAELNNGLSLMPFNSGYYLITIVDNQKYLKTVRVLKQ